MVEAHGRTLAVAVSQVLDAPMKPVQGPLKTAFAFAEPALEDVPTREELQAGLPGENDVHDHSVNNLLAKYDHEGKLRTSVPYAVQVWQFGDDLTHIALAGEPCVDYSLRFKAAYGWENTWVSGYNDELLAYIPSKRVRCEGGYEGIEGMQEYGLPGAFGPGIEETIAAKVQEMVFQTT